MMSVEEALDVLRSLPEFNDEESKVFDAVCALQDYIWHLEFCENERLHDGL